ncbi:MAG: hypothetical protein ACT4P1_03370 [Sporichthyaceae bacterium]
MALDPDPVLSERSADDADAGWGESGGSADAREAWLREQCPPHHGG